MTIRHLINYSIQVKPSKIFIFQSKGHLYVYELILNDNTRSIRDYGKYHSLVYNIKTSLILNDKMHLEDILK